MKAATKINIKVVEQETSKVKHSNRITSEEV